MSLTSAVRIGSQRPTLTSLPVDRRGSAGPEAVDLAALAGLDLDDWQAWCLGESLAEDSDQRWSAFEVGILVSRQNGKGSVLEARQIAGLFLLHERLQVHTAHEFKTCFEHFLRIVNLIEGCPDLDRRVTRIRRGAGEQAIELRGGERLRFVARSSGSGRGMSGDAVYLDEAFALTPQMMGALLPTLSARPNPQVWYTSSAPLEGSSVLHGLRRRALDGGSPRLFFAEWGNDAGVDVEDRDAWYRANPALGIRISEDFVEAELAAMSAQPEEFRRERLGVPDVPAGEVEPAIPLDVWTASTDPGSQIASHHQWSVVVSPDRRMSTIGVAGRRADGKLHVEVVERRAGVTWVVERILAGLAGRKVPLRVHKSGPEGALADVLRERGVEVEDVSSADVAQATGQFIDAALAGSVRHIGQPTLDKALAGAVLRTSSDGAVSWSQRQSQVEITPLQAVTVALGGVPTQSVYAGSFTDLDDLVEG